MTTTVSAILAATSRVHWLLELEIGGEVHRFADDSVVVLDELGNAYQYLPGLDTDALPPDPEAVGFVVNAGIDWARLLARGHSFERRPAVLRRWYEGQTLDDARVVLEGVTEDVALGAANEPLTLSVVRDAPQLSRLVPSPQRMVDDTTWPVRVSPTVYVLEDNARGHYVPIVIGCPGHAPDQPNPLPAVPALSVDWKANQGDSRFAFHQGAAHAATVALYNESATPPTVTLVAVGQVDDLLGQDTAVAEYGTAGVPDSANWYIGLQDDSTFGGGLLNRRRDGPLRGLGDVLRYLLEQFSDVPVDVGRMESEAVLLNRYKVDTYINSPVRIEEWIDELLLPWLPLTKRRSTQGVWYQHWRWDATAVDAVGSIRADSVDVDRVAPLQLRRASIFNEFTIHYRRLRESQSFYRTRVLSAENQFSATGQAVTYGTKADERVTGSSLCRRSQQLYGLRPRTPLQSGWLWDDATVGLLLRQWATAFCFPRLGTAYTGPLTLERYNKGDIVLLTDSELHLTDEPCLVEQRSDGLTDVRLDLTLLRSPGQSDRLTT